LAGGPARSLTATRSPSFHHRAKATGFTFPATLSPVRRDGQDSRPLAELAAATRAPLLADIPTAKEAGARDFEVTAWNGLFVKTGTPAPIVARLNKAVAEALADEDLKKSLLEMGIVANPTSPEERSSRVKSPSEPRSSPGINRTALDGSTRVMLSVTRIAVLRLNTTQESAMVTSEGAA
jgi:Tripartite tricarboxylate transporter family receptor